MENRECGMWNGDNVGWYDESFASMDDYDDDMKMNDGWPGGYGWWGWGVAEELLTHGSHLSCSV